MRRPSLLLGLALVVIVAVAAPVQQQYPTGNVIFIHPDGTGLNHWNAARMYWQGADGLLHWDQLPEMAVYRGHLTDRLTASSNGGATVHAFGYKVSASGSFGQDGRGDDARSITALSGYEGSIMREAAAAGQPVGVVNDGSIAEPGTAAFLAEVDNRDETNEIVEQLLDGRPSTDGEPLPAVILGGGERYFLPDDAPVCEDEITLNCAVHVDPITQQSAARDDGRNLLEEAADLGYTVVRTRAEFDALTQQLDKDPNLAPMVLGLFAADHTFNDAPEEAIIGLELLDDDLTDTRAGRLVLWGDVPGTPGHNPPTAAEMTEIALTVLERHADAAGLPFLLVTEVESTDNLPNNANAIGMLRAVKRADDTIGVARDYLANNPDTLVIVAADSDAGGAQVFSPAPTGVFGNVSESQGNPTGFGLNSGFALDGIEGQATAPFSAAPDAFGSEIDFAIGWVGQNDVAGGVLSRAEGLNADLLRTAFDARFDNTDIYRMQYVTLFGELLPPTYGERAPDRDD